MSRNKKRKGLGIRQRGDDYRVIGVILVLAYLFIVFTRPAHSGILRRSILRELRNTIVLNVELLIIILIYLFIVHSTQTYSRVAFGLFAIFYTFAMRPGLTGMWQTSGRSDITDFEEIVQLDNEYIRNFSLGLDVKIIFKTFFAVFAMKGSK